jgi:hypothetical protein
MSGRHSSQGRLKHANICSVYDAGEHEGTAYITMDFIDGVPLSRFIGTEKLKSVDGILQMISIIADAVGHAHCKGVIHRDLKPMPLAGHVCRLQGQMLDSSHFRQVTMTLRSVACDSTFLSCDSTCGNTSDERRFLQTAFFWKCQ